MIPETRYAKSGDVHIAYQVVGSGPRDVIFVPGWVSNIELLWDEPVLARCLTRLTAFARLIVFDKRGTGLSDRVPDSDLPTQEQRMDDVRAVMDAVGIERAALFSMSEGCSMSALFAATYPTRTSALILFGAFAKRMWDPEYPWGPRPAARQQWLDLLERDWGNVADLESLAPSMLNDERFKRWWGSYMRHSASPSAAIALGRMNTGIDIRSILPAIHVPTLVLHHTGDRDANVAEGRYLAEHIPSARFVELPGDSHLFWVGDAEAVIDEIEEFLTGVRHSPELDRVLATVLYADMVSSTERAAALGDRRWRDLLEQFYALMRRELARFRGHEIDTTGDGFLATFDGPARAIRCALSVRDAVRQLGIQIRAGLHTGEIELMGDDVGGIAVHIGARVMALAGASEVLVSSTVKDLVAGSGIPFSERGSHTLKGVPGEWHLFAVER